MLQKIKLDTAFFNLLLIVLGLVCAVLGRTTWPEVPELAMAGAFLVGLGIQWLSRSGDAGKSLQPSKP